MSAIKSSPLSSLLAYPNPSQTEHHQRVSEVINLGIEEIMPGGCQKVNGQSVLGKGYCGIVLKSKWKGPDTGLLTVALKARRIDASKPNLNVEAKALRLANQYAVGPKLFAHSDNFIVMEYITGPSIRQWFESKPSIQSINIVIYTLLSQAYRLDTCGLDHGNLRCLTEHVLFRGNEPVLIDFSSSSQNRRPANVTTLTQGLFLGTIIPSFIEKVRPLPQRETLISLLRRYKENGCAQNFQTLLEFIVQPQAMNISQPEVGRQLKNSHA